jgi:hypothetical protein
VSDQMTTDLEARLDAWLASRAPADLPASLVSRVQAIPLSGGTERPSRWSWLPGRHTGTGRPALVLVLAGALLAAFAAGAVLTGSLVERETPPSAPPATPSPAQSPVSDLGSWPDGILPATVPDTILHGIIATPLGRARWVHLSEGTTSQPDWLSPSVGPNGTLVWFAPGGSSSACYNAPTTVACTDPPPARLWVSDDALAARVERHLPVEAAQANLFSSGGRYWFVAAAGVWWSSDLEAWQRTDLSGLRSPGPSSLSWTTDLHDLVTIGTTTVATVTYTAADEGSLLGYPGRRVRLARNDSGEYVARESHLMRDGGNVDLEPITVTSGPLGIRFTNAAGRVVGRVASVSVEFADSWVLRGTIVYDQLVVLDGQQWSPVDLPGPRNAVSTLLVIVGGDFQAFFVDADEHVRAWRSSDGRTWTGGQVATTADGTPLLASDGITYRDGGDGRTLLVYGPDGSSGWASSDGVQWVDNRDPDIVPPEPIPAGRIRTPVQTQDGTWQVSRDGVVWETVPGLAKIVDKTEPTGSGGNGETSLGNAIFFTVDDDATSTRDLWIIEFEDGSP